MYCNNIGDFSSPPSSWYMYSAPPWILTPSRLHGMRLSPLERVSLLDHLKGHPRFLILIINSKDRFSVSKEGDLYDVLFEVSNEIRHKILLSLEERAKNITELSKIFHMSFPEISRHISRLGEVRLTRKDLDGLYRLTPFGKVVIKQLRELSFTSRHREYFASHSLANLPLDFIRRVGDLNESTFTASIMDFLYNIEAIIKGGEEYVWFLVDQYPVTTLSSIVEALGRGVEFRTIEPENQISGPHLILQAPDEAQALSRVRSTPLLEQRTADRVDVIVYLSEKRCALAFPDINEEFDYLGFTATDERALKWCRDLFLYYWEDAEPKVYISPTEYVRPPRTKPTMVDTARSIVVEGRDDSRVDAQTVQDAVDNYDEVILKGLFNLGPTRIQISRSVVIRGEGRENEIPKATIYKKGWKFPFTKWDSAFKVDGEGIDVTIENINFTDFNCACIWGSQGNSLKIRNNRITLTSGYGRGMTFGAFGDLVFGIWIDSIDIPSARAPSVLGIFRGGVTIEGNYLDFARGGAGGGFLTRGGLEEDPEYRPDLFNHEYYVGIGIYVCTMLGAVRLENNIIRNANARGIAVTDNNASAYVRIRHNTIESDVYGSYVFSSQEAGVGILAQSAWGAPYPGFYVEIEENSIKMDKLNYCGIKVLGPSIGREGAGKLRGGIIRNNRLQLMNGYEGIHIRKCDDFDVAGNTISGEAYYGIRISGRRSSKELDLRAISNMVEGNDMGELRIREPDEYSNAHTDGSMFAGSPRESITAHVWMGKFSKKNTVKIKTGETVIDEGEENSIIREEDGE